MADTEFYDDEELVELEEEKNWKGIGIALLVITAICSLIGLAIIIVTPRDQLDLSKLKRIELEGIISGKYEPQLFNGTWISGTEFIFKEEDGSISIYDASNNSVTRRLLTDSTVLHDNKIEKFYLSADRQFLLLEGEGRKALNLSRTAKYFIYNITGENIITSLTDLAKKVNPKDEPIIQYAAWSPKGNAYVYVSNNDIYYVPSVSTIDGGPINQIRRLTTNGLAGIIYNGVPDWLYSERIFGPEKMALWWSADGSKLCYATFDDTLVESHVIMSYNDYNVLLPRLTMQKFSKAGRVNPKATISVVSNLNSGSPKTESVTPPREMGSKDSYLMQVGWLAGGDIIVMWSIRAQNSSLIARCRPDNQWKCEQFTTISSNIPIVRDSYHELLLLSDDAKINFIRIPRPDTLVGSYYHIGLFGEKDKYIHFITYGQFDVTRLLAYDKQLDTLYFEAIGEEDTTTRHVYKIESVTATNRRISCISCHFSEEAKKKRDKLKAAMPTLPPDEVVEAPEDRDLTLSKECLYNEAHFSPSLEFAVFTCRGPGLPRVELHSNVSWILIGQPNPLFDTRSLFDQTNGTAPPIVKVLEVNAKLNETLEGHLLPLVKILTVPIDDQYNAQVKLYLPRDYDAEHEFNKYPLVVEANNFDEPTVDTRYTIHYGTYLVSKKNFIYAQIQSDRIKKASAQHNIYQLFPHQYQAGSQRQFYKMPSPVYSFLDVLAVIRYIREKQEEDDEFPYIDSKNVAVWGWGVGGFTALSTLVADEKGDVISCGVGVATLTDWRYADSALAEQYLGMPWPQKNFAEYETTSLVKRAQNLLNRKLLLIHGTADDKIHLQHTMQLIKALNELQVAGGIIHETQLYVDEGHSLSNVLYHLYSTMDAFFERCFFDKAWGRIDRKSKKRKESSSS